jgi:aromatic ring-opening dioxygenase LigB subunit
MKCLSQLPKRKEQSLLAGILMMNSSTTSIPLRFLVVDSILRIAEARLSSQTLKSNSTFIKEKVKQWVSHSVRPGK